MRDMGLISVKGYGGPAAVLLMTQGHMVVAQCSGEDDLAIRIIHMTDFGSTHWDRNVPYSQRLLKKVGKLCVERHKAKLAPIMAKLSELTGNRHW